MNEFTTRVELHDATVKDYEKLHSEMENQKFSRTITSSDDGTIYHLPTAEYNKIGNFTKYDVLNSAKAAATQTGKKFSILVTVSNGRTWTNLPVVSRK